MGRGGFIFVYGSVRLLISELELEVCVRRPLLEFYLASSGRMDSDAFGIWDLDIWGLDNR